MNVHGGAPDSVSSQLPARLAAVADGSATRIGGVRVARADAEGFVRRYLSGDDVDGYPAYDGYDGYDAGSSPWQVTDADFLVARRC